MANLGRNVRRATWLAVLVFTVASAALYLALKPGFGLLGLPEDARAALLAETGLTAQPSALRIREVTQIGPYLAVVYAAAGNTGAGLMSRESGAWEITGVTDPGALRQGTGQQAGVAAARAGGIEVLFVCVSNRQIARVVVRYPGDGTVLDQRVRGTYAVLWRPAPVGDGSYSVEMYDRAGRRILP